MMKIRNHTNSNLKIKVACIFFAFFMWVYVMSDLDPVDNRILNSVSVSISNLEDLDNNNLTLSPNQDLKANIEIKGRRSIIAKKVMSGVKLQLTIQEPKVGVNNAKIAVLGDNTDLVYTITPSSLNVNLEEKIAVEKKINIKSVGSLAENFYIDTIKLSKDNVYVSGASSLIEKIDKVEVEIDLSSNSEDFSKISKLKILDKDSNEISGLSVDDSNVVVSVTVKKEKLVPIKVDILNNSQNINISEFSIIPENIKIQGKPSIVDSISEIKTKQIDVLDLLGNSSITLELELPDNIYSNIKEITLKSTVEQVAELKEYEFTYSKDEIEIKNADILDNSTINLDTIQLKFSSTEELNKEDIHLYVDESTMAENKVNILYNTDKLIENVTITPSYIEVIESETTE